MTYTTRQKPRRRAAVGGGINTAFASARSYVAVCSSDDVNARSARAFITVRYLIRASRAIAMMLVADQPAAAFTREPLACASRGGLLGDLSSLKLSYLTPEHGVCSVLIYSGR